MRLDQVSARIAPRTPWQAMDMGTHLYRAWWKPLTLVWLSFSMPVLLLALWLTVSGHSGFGALLLWWLKPVTERPLLEYCARTLFNQPVTLPALWREFHRYALPGLLPWLLWRRIYLTRSFSVPVSQLENQHGPHYRERIRVLHMGQPNRASMLTLLMAHIEFIISYAFTVLVMMMMPGQYYLSDIDWMLTGTHYATLGLITWYITLTVLQPLYVASGFALYLNKRTWLEGWDLELGMRRIGERRRSLTSSTLAVFCLLPILALAPAQQARAGNPQQDAIEVVAGPDFMPIEVQEQWRLRSDNDTMEAVPDEQHPEWLVDFSNGCLMLTAPATTAACHHWRISCVSCCGLRSSHWCCGLCGITGTGWPRFRPGISALKNLSPISPGWIFDRLHCLPIWPKACWPRLIAAMCARH